MQLESRWRWRRRRSSRRGRDFPCILYASWKMFCNRFLTPSFTCCLVLCFYECISSGGGERGGGMLCVEYDELSVAWSGFCGVPCQFLLRMFFDFWQMTFCVCECVFGACGLWLRSAILAWLLICLITDINFKFEKPQTVKEIYRELERVGKRESEVCSASNSWKTFELQIENAFRI